MKLGCCLGMLPTEDPKIGHENIAAFRDLGYDYIELPLAQIADLPPEEFHPLFRQIEAGDMPVEACNNFFPARIRLTGEDARLEAALEYARRALDLAACLGAKIVVLGSAGAKNIPDGFPHHRARAQFLELLRGVDAIAAPLGITVVIEPLNRLECNFITTLDQGLEMVREAGCEHIQLLVDYYHMRMEGESASLLIGAGDALRHLHIAAKNGRTFPRFGDGEDYRHFFSQLKAAGYTARISIEAFSKDILSDAAASAALLRPLLG